METRLIQFCRALGSVVRPLLPPVRAAVARLGGEGSPTRPALDGLPALRECKHKLRQLVEKVEGQQAYMVIFGPLKSGKSTLMNAVTASYVSEVTSLPAYPCLVYVSHADETEFVLTHYDGDSETLANPAVLEERIRTGHRELAHQIRQVERRADGAHFDPAVHYPTAVRRIDVRLPAAALKASGAVLVDTPGLYSRMKFGYDQMTRDFRDTAACAVFVVKTDNLFLEQVFEEFHELLDIFGRIFLVVNLDSRKLDLQPDGSLAPSLESENPQRIIEAFENLAMSAPLKQAAESGRLKIYTVDLLQAASNRLRGARGSAEPPIPQTGFEALRRDMTEYLNSTDYFRTFVQDTLRYATALCGDLRHLCEADEMDELRQQVARLEEERTAAEERARSHERLRDADWPALLRPLHQHYGATLEHLAHQLIDELPTRLTGIIDRWFETDASLSALATARSNSFAALIEDDKRQVATRALHELQTGTEASAGLRFDEQLARDLEEAQIDLASLRGHALTASTRRFVDGWTDFPLPYADIPVRKKLWDWMLFRGEETVRERIFGSLERPDRRIPISVKLRCLGDPARSFILGAARRHAEEILPLRFEEIGQAILSDYYHSLVKEIQSRVDALTERNEATIAALDHRLQQLGELLATLDEVQQAAGRVAAGLGNVTDEFADVLGEPTEGAGVPGALEIESA